MGDVLGKLDTTHELEGKLRASARNVTMRTEEHRLKLMLLQDATLITVNVVSPMGGNLKESLHAMHMRVTAVVTHGICHGAATALAAA